MYQLDAFGWKWGAETWYCNAVRELHFPLNEGKLQWLSGSCPLSLRCSAWPPPSSLALTHHLCIIVPLPQLTSLYAVCTWSLPARTRSCRRMPGLSVLRNFSDEDELRPSGLAVSSNCVSDHRVAHVKLASRWRGKQDISPTHDTPTRLYGVVDQQTTPWIVYVVHYCCNIIRLTPAC
jgi:hypothetical protein